MVVVDDQVAHRHPHRRVAEVAGGLGGGSGSGRGTHAGRDHVGDPADGGVVAHHEGRELGGRCAGPAHRAHPLAVTHHRQRVADGHGLADLVGDEHDAHALVDDGPQRAEQRVDLLRREVRRRLVEHKDLGSAVEGLEDLHPLAQADRQVRHTRPGVDRQAEPLGELGDAGRRLLEVDRRPGRQRGAEHDVLGHRVGVHLEEVLVDHADPVGDGVPRVADLHWGAVEHHGPAVRPVQPVEHVHQRRLAGAVAAEEAVHLAGADGQVDAVQGHDGAEGLPDPLHGQEGTGRSFARLVTPLVHRGHLRSVRHLIGVRFFSTVMAPDLMSATAFSTLAATAGSTFFGGWMETPASKPSGK